MNQVIAINQQPSEPQFLRENWKLVLATASRNHAVVSVLEGVATVTNGAVTLRSPIRAADGFYHIAQNNELAASLDDHRGFPDMRPYQPPFKEMTPSRALSTAAVLDITHFLELARQAKTLIVMDRYGMSTMNRAPLVYDFRERLGCEMPFQGEEMGFVPANLLLALKEMRRYSGQDVKSDICCYFSHCNRQDRFTPLVIGHSWERCALVMPTRY